MTIEQLQERIFARGDTHACPTLMRLLELMMEHEIRLQETPEAIRDRELAITSLEAAWDNAIKYISGKRTEAYREEKRGWVNQTRYLEQRMRGNSKALLCMVAVQAVTVAYVLGAFG